MSAILFPLQNIIYLGTINPFTVKRKKKYFKSI